MAARAGAERVTAVEMVPAICSVAAQIVERNGYLDVVNVINTRSDQLSEYALGERADICVSELIDDHIIGDGVDMYGTFWFYWWISECLSTLTSPGFTDVMFHPLGKDIFAHTGNNFVDAVVAQPFQALLGFPRYQPVFVGVVLFVNALAMRPLARRVLGRGGAGLSWGGFAAVLLWMANPFILFELMTGRLTQAF